MKNKKRFYQFTMILICLLLGLSTYAQQTITGTLRSSSGGPVSGATVIVKGTNKTVVSDNNGKFTIDAPIGSTLTISSVGFQEKEVTVSGTEINEVLQVANTTLNEVVVIGYQSVRRKDLTGATSVVN